jgi:hypothetical protein
MKGVNFQSIRNKSGMNSPTDFVMSLCKHAIGPTQ